MMKERLHVRLCIYVNTRVEMTEISLQTSLPIESRIMHVCTFRHATRRDFHAGMLNANLDNSLNALSTSSGKNSPLPRKRICCIRGHAFRFLVLFPAFTRSSSRIESHRLILFSCLHLRSTAPEIGHYLVINDF